MRVVTDGIENFLQDESNSKSTSIEKVYIPENTQELLDLIRQTNQPWTIYGGGTGLVGGAVSDGGIIISTSALNKITIDRKNKIVCVGSGALLKDLNKELLKNNLWYPVDSTEQTATIGGNVATNAWGPRSHKYGSIRNFVQELEIILPLKKRLKISRGEIIADNDTFNFLLDDKEINFKITDLSEKIDLKSSAGYYMKKNMDLIDLFIGAEGTLGIVTDIKLKVFDLPYDIYAFMLSFSDRQKAFEFIKYIKQKDVLSLEYMDNNSVNLIKHRYPILKNIEYLVFFEKEIEEKKEESILQDINDMLEKFNIAIDRVKISSTKKKNSIVYEIRESLPQTINEMIRQKNIKKISTDFAVREENFDKMIKIYDNILSKTKIKYFIFGHIGMNSLHINFVPEDERQIEESLELYNVMAKEIAFIGGTISAEHGIGKLKKKYLQYMYSDQILKKMKSIKEIFDPCNLCNRGNIFD
ncbi:MAG: FAD-binding oxidoreductase [Candidatus Goldbacteria bacterium]|nr:FAD-binding oxidoreductase [Candidatus Goldiibacteriota bacterium]